MAYGLKYEVEFDNVVNTRYRVEILQKDYEGAVNEMRIAGTPVKHSWQTDDTKAPIKGSSLVLNILNDATGLPQVLTYSDDSLYMDTQLDGPHIYISGGFIPEVGVPFTVSGHSDPDVNDTWTPLAVLDLGGGIYDSTLDVGVFSGAASPDSAIITVTRNVSTPIEAFYSEEDDEFKCKFYEENELRFEGFLVQDDCSELMADYVHEITLSFTDNLGLLKDVAYSAELERISLLEVVATCIQATGLELDTFIYANIFETTFTTDDSFLAQTFVDTQTFYKTDGFDNCYNVLTAIFDRFNLTLFQALGAWRIVRWDEVRYGAIPYYQYDSSFSLSGTGTMDAEFITGFEQSIYPETGLTRSIFRPYKYDKETFNYVQPKYLLRNFDLQDLGALLNTYTDGPNTINEYEFTDWNPGGFSPQPNYFIRVISNAGGDELDRYVVVEDATGDTARSVVSTPFEVAEGDMIEVSFRFRTTVSQSGPLTVQLAVRLYDGITTNYADEDPVVGWKVGLGWNFQVPIGSNTLDYQSVTIDPPPIPFDGLLYIYLPQAVLSSPGPGDETDIKDIRIIYTPVINDSTKIIGHVHKNEQDKIIKNNEDEEIKIDDSPRNSIIGNLFLESFTGVLQDRTTLWYRLSNPSELLRIGQITTLETMLWRRTPRTKLEGTFYGIIGMSMLAVLKNVAFEELNFLFGSLEIDYKNNNMNCTMWEIYEDGDTDGDLDADYTFNYLYDDK